MKSVGAAWVPQLGFVLLGCFLLQKAIRRRARRTFAWGRGGGRVPVSRWGYAAWGATCFAIALVVARAPEPSRISVLALFACFGAVILAGFVDTLRHRRSSDRPARTREEQR